MKKLVSLVTLLFLSGMLFAQNDYIISSDEKPDVDFEKFDSYRWSSYVIDKTSASYSLNNILLKNNIKYAIEEEMEGLGFEKNDSSELILGFIVFDVPTEFRGYGQLEEDNSYYNYWSGFSSKERLNGVKTYNFKAGSLVVHMIDSETGSVIWQGYASGVMDNNIFDSNPNNVAEAVQLIFEEFDHRADDFESTGR